ncbi:SH2 domain-containing adapter protein D [Xenopus laevis]|uniref:SH2 domain-containing protein n=2 Tax=Xenopus laevis TaxID=8355 RepID=A0A974E0I3_XENLA|nr:SH2 domain-containing adapter protein D [Xenopus laevis]OCU00342.1 hypothetical protein XELAEV_18006113mg [Xenopus laevis]
MARWLKDYLNFKKVPPKPPKPDYTESEILRAYRAQKDLDFEDPYQESKTGYQESPERLVGLSVNMMSPRHRLIKLESTENVKSTQHKQREESAREENINCKVNPSNTRLPTTEGKNDELVGGDEPEDIRYMDPYESQSTDLHCIGERAAGTELKLYDFPYQEQCHKTFQDSHQHLEDERPADEYDQPWEWKKDDINRAFAVQFEGSDWQQSSLNRRERLLQPSAKSFRRLQKNSPSTSPEISASPKQCGVLTEECMAYSARNVTLNPPLQTQVWYHGTLNRLEAEKYLQNCRPGSFVIRTEHDIEYFMSIRGSDSTLHLKVICTENGRFMLGESGPSFTCILELVEHYMKHPLLLQNEEQLFLQCQVFTVK